MRLRDRTSTRFALSLGALSVALLANVSAGAEQAWDQATVTSLAADLAKATRQLKNTLRRDPSLAATAESGDRNAVRFWEAIDGLEKSARQLANGTKEGKGRAETLPIAQKIRTLVRDAEQFSAGLMMGAFVEEKLGPVEELLGRLEPYYF